jgi:hypothetical protein
MNIDINSPATKAVFIKNLFSVLSADRGTRLFGRASIAHALRELALGKEAVQELFNAWKSAPGEIYPMERDVDNRDMVLLICSALLSDETTHSEIMSSLCEYASAHGISARTVNTIFANKLELIGEPSLVRRAARIKVTYLGNGDLPQGVSRKKIAGGEQSFFIANQVTDEGFDELQRLLMAYYLDVHAAIDGPPGVGKTHSVMEIAKILGLSLYTKTCSNRTTESHIISYPVLGAQNGVSITTHVNGPLVCAMTEPGIFYGDEFNLLKEDVQKRMNSAFDERRTIDRSDGAQMKAKKGFWGVISYNPTQNFTSRDLEDSVADRFIHLHYDRWPSDFKAYVAHRKAVGEKAAGGVSDFGISLSWRGVSADGRFFRGTQENGSIAWRDFFNDEKAAKAPEYVYQVHDSKQTFGHGRDSAKVLAELERNAYSGVTFARMLSSFTDLLNSLGRTGKSPMLKKIGLGDTLENEDLELLTLHESSARIEMAALRHYHYLLERGFNRFLAQTYATRLVIDQVCYGQYRDKMLRTNSVYQLVMMIAKSMHLFGDVTRYNTNLASTTAAVKK